MTLPRPAGVVGRELIMAKFHAFDFPSGGLRLPDEALPLRFRPRQSGAGGFAPLNSMRDPLSGAKVADDDFAQRKRRDNIELVRGGVERIPKGFEHLAALLGQDFLRPNGLVQLILFGF